MTKLLIVGATASGVHYFAIGHPLASGGASNAVVEKNVISVDRPEAIEHEINVGLIQTNNNTAPDGRLLNSHLLDPTTGLYVGTAPEVVTQIRSDLERDLPACAVKRRFTIPGAPRNRGWCDSVNRCALTVLQSHALTLSLPLARLSSPFIRCLIPVH